MKKMRAMNIKKKAMGFMLGAMMLVSALPVQAATTTVQFSQSGNLYGIKTSVSGYSTNRTAWAQLKNGGKTIYGETRVAKNKSGSVSATKTCTSGTVTRTGGSRAS